MVNKQVARDEESIGNSLIFMFQSSHCLLPGLWSLTITHLYGAFEKTARKCLRQKVVLLDYIYRIITPSVGEKSR